METIFEKLFDTYGETVMREQRLHQSEEIQQALVSMPLDPSVRVDLCDLFSSCCLRNSTAAFTIGLHLGLSIRVKS